MTVQLFRSSHAPLLPVLSVFYCIGDIVFEYGPATLQHAISKKSSRTFFFSIALRIALHVCSELYMRSHRPWLLRELVFSERG